MNPERLAKLAPGSVRLGAARGGVAEVTPQDLAAALHRLTKLEYELLSLKFAFAGRLSLIFNALVSECRLPHASVAKICAQAAREYFGDNACPQCAGTKIVTQAGRINPCPKCEATGVYYFSVGKKLQPELDRLVGWLQSIESDALEKIRAVDEV